MRRSVALFILLALVLIACAPRYRGPIQEAVRAFADGPAGAQLVILENMVGFDPGPVPRLDSVLYVGGDDLAESEEACEPLRNGIACFVQEGGRDVSEPVFLAVTGTNLSVNVTYYLPDHPIPFGFYVAESAAPTPEPEGESVPEPGSTPAE